MPRPPRAAARHKLGSLEIGRFLAASLVVLNHVLDDLPRYAANQARLPFGGWSAPGSLGVEYFFLLSGFVMLLSHGRDFGRIAAVPRFWWRRACRIYPVFWLALLIPFFVLRAHWGVGQALGLLSLASADIAHYIPPAWSLRYELAFYLVFGLALLPVLGRPLLALWAAGIVWRALPVPWQQVTAPGITHALRHLLAHRLDMFSNPFDALFLAGLIAAWAYRRLPLGRAGGLFGVIIGLALLLADGPALGWYYRYATGAGLLPLGAGFGALMLGLAALERAGALRLGATAARLGEISYPLYILHVPLMLIMEATCTSWLRLPLWGLYALAAAGLAAIYLIATLVAWTVDQPVQRALRRLAPR